jgi:hypothetical protein
VQTPEQSPASQTYVHGLPFCHSPPALQVRGVLPEQSSDDGAQTPLHPPASQTNGHAPPLSSHAPASLHRCGWRPLHVAAPGEHAPVHDPAVQSVVQGSPLFCQVPVSSHFCGWRPLHVTLPGVHVPVQPPSAQTYAHAAPFCQVPFTLHVCGVVAASGLHWVEAGVQSPVHAPLKQALFAHAAGGLHPPASHVSTPLPAHVVVEATQMPHAPALQYGAARGQSTGTPHCPFAAHVSTA